jgi:hypothetical protein
LTVGGNQIDYLGNKPMPTANLTTAKLLINLTISTPGAIFLGIDLANFYLNTPLPNHEYMRLCLDIIPEEITLAYNLRNIVNPEDGSTLRSRKGCMASPRPAFWQTSCWNNNYLPGHSSRDDLILSAKLIRIAPENSSF